MILHVADAFEAMTAARPYRMTPLTTEQALAELRKFAGVQFDPVVVDAFVRTLHVDGVPDPGRPAEPRQIPLIAQAADRMTGPAASESDRAGRARLPTGASHQTPARASAGRPTAPPATPLAARRAPTRATHDAAVNRPADPGPC